jgi:hypothetical protein
MDGVAPPERSLVGIRAHAPAADDPAHRYAAVIDDDADPVCVYVVGAACAISDGNIVVTRHNRYELTGDTEHDALVCDQAAGEARALEEGRDAGRNETAAAQLLRDEQAAVDRAARRLTAEVARHSIGQRR